MSEEPPHIFEAMVELRARLPLVESGLARATDRIAAQDADAIERERRLAGVESRLETLSRALVVLDEDRQDVRAERRRHADRWAERIWVVAERVLIAVGGSVATLVAVKWGWRL